MGKGSSGAERAQMQAASQQAELSRQMAPFLQEQLQTETGLLKTFAERFAPRIEEQLGLQTGLLRTMTPQQQEAFGMLGPLMRGEASPLIQPSLTRQIFEMNPYQERQIFEMDQGLLPQRQAASREALEQQFNVARGQVEATGARGGGMQRRLDDLGIQRAMGVVGQEQEFQTQLFGREREREQFRLDQQMQNQLAREERGLMGEQFRLQQILGAQEFGEQQELANREIRRQAFQASIPGSAPVSFANPMLARGQSSNPLLGVQGMGMAGDAFGNVATRGAQRQAGLGRGLGTLFGTGAGALLGGPMGAKAGASAGGAFGGGLGGK